VAETSIDELIQHTAQRKNRTVLWKFPELPVLCAFNANGAAVVSDKPAGNHQLTQIMSQAARAAGLMGQHHAHDLRHGAATETTNLKGKLKGMANKGATTVLGHNASPANRPLSAHYVGAHDEDVWTKRLDDEYIDPIYETQETGQTLSAQIPDVQVTGTHRHMRIRGALFYRSQRSHQGIQDS
jgi:hypothetical protein